MQREEREARTPDGRLLRFQVAGSEDGDLIFFHTGTPGSRHLYEGTIRECAKRGLRLACFSRPGYDGSDRLPGRSFADGLADTTAVAEALGHESFYVIGHSCGGGFALADAALLPDRVRAAGVVATLAPRSASGLAWRAETRRANGEEFDALEEGALALERFLKDQAEKMRAVKKGTDLTDNFSDLYGPADRATFVDEVLDFQLKCYSLAVRGGIWGWFDDDHAMYGDWGFDLSRIAVPVSIWQGDEDRIIPVVHGEWLAHHVPDARFHLLTGEGHASLMNRHLSAMLDELIALAA